MLQAMIASSRGKEDQLAEDLIEIMAIMRFGADGFEGIEKLVEHYREDYT